MLAPEYLRLLEQRKSANLPTVGIATPAELREQTPARIALAGPIPDGVTIEHREIPTRDTACLDAHLIRPTSSSSDRSSLLLYFHGGGWVHNTIDIYDASLALLAIESGMTVLSVSYRKAPEHPFPTPLNDCWDTLQWCRLNTHLLNIEADEIIIAGDSSGGNLAAAVALMARDEIPLRGQILIYPCLDPTLESDSAQQFASGFGLDRTAMQWYWQQYVQVEHQMFDARVAPLHADNTRGAAPAFIAAAEYDILRDDARLYHDKLQASDIDSTYLCYAGAIHGFFTFASVSSMPMDLIRDIAGWISTRISAYS
jgi:acetyl esterase